MRNYKVNKCCLRLISVRNAEICCADGEVKLGCLSMMYGYGQKSICMRFLETRLYLSPITLGKAMAIRTEKLMDLSSAIEVFVTDGEGYDIIIVKGSVSGPKGGYVIITK